MKQEPVLFSTTSEIDESMQEEESTSIQSNTNDPEGEEHLLPPWVPMHPRSSPDETHYYNPETGESTWDRQTASNTTEEYEQQQEEKNNLVGGEEHFDEDTTGTILQQLTNVLPPTFPVATENIPITEAPTITRTTADRFVSVFQSSPSGSCDPRIQILKKLEEEQRSRLLQQRQQQQHYLDEKKKHDFTAKTSTPTENSQHHQKKSGQQ